jgi:hypothetical protein
LDLVEAVGSFRGVAIGPSSCWTSSGSWTLSKPLDCHGCPIVLSPLDLWRPLDPLEDVGSFRGVAIGRWTSSGSWIPSKPIVTAVRSC